MTDRHGSEVLAIYQAGIDEGNATFETRVPAWRQFVAAKLAGHSYVAADEGGVLGWVAASPISARPAYAGVYGSFLLHAERAAQRYGVPAHEILHKVGEAGYVGGQEDMIIDIAIKLAESRNP